jgi:hypothetical protein
VSGFVMNFLNLSDDELDEHIYRIMPQNYVVSLFIGQQNVLSGIHNWKDKFENFQLNLGGMLDGKPFEYGFKADFVGQCWTRDALSEAMWGIYANNVAERYLRVRSTPRKLLAVLAEAHPKMPQDTCFFGKVEYKKETELKAYLRCDDRLELAPLRFARSLLLKRHAFRHEREVRLLYFGDAKEQDHTDLYRYAVDPHAMITQIMADPNRDRGNWLADKAAIQAATGFSGEIKRSKIYDPPDWDTPEYR